MRAEAKALEASHKISLTVQATRSTISTIPCHVFKILKLGDTILPITFSFSFTSTTLTYTEVYWIYRWLWHEVIFVWRVCGCNTYTWSFDQGRQARKGALVICDVSKHCQTTLQSRSKITKKPYMCCDVNLFVHDVLRPVCFYLKFAVYSRASYMVYSQTPLVRRAIGLKVSWMTWSLGSLLWWVK